MTGLFNAIHNLLTPFIKFPLRLKVSLTIFTFVNHIFLKDLV